MLPRIHVHGCSFHWTQAVWRKIQGLGLAVVYHQKDSTYKFCRKLMVLPFPKNVVLQAKLVGEETVLRDQREKYKKHQQRIFQSWEDYEMGEIEPMELLQQCAELNGPVM